MPDQGLIQRPADEEEVVSLPAVAVSQSPEEKFREYLTSRPKPQRYTDQQRDLVRFIFSQHDHFDADQLIDDIKEAGLNVSRATVYRTLTKLVDAGLLRRLEIGPRMCYEHGYGYPQHEHLQCERLRESLRQPDRRDGLAFAGRRRSGRRHQDQFPALLVRRIRQQLQPHLRAGPDV